eukprot:TRINITY_DN102547_c0_g1_i1.p1 TRINITY_DN102547_c0_g1~~TRINITY_DN102547_c0_g1_i1.p1  ORF type:complete len:1354 (+),score=282.21 TRINITY_DN102547_c0_g1_i1:91-4152(+)
MAAEPAAPAVELSFATHRLEFVRAVGQGAFGQVSLVRVYNRDAEEASDAASGDAATSSSSSWRLAVLKRANLMHFCDVAAESALSEARLLKQLGTRHDSILRCFDFRLVQGTAPVLELLLEFAQLGDLSRRINLSKTAGESGLPEAEVVIYARDVASGLAYMHSLLPKVLHRDVKPANVVLFYKEDSDDLLIPVCAKLADFGIAKVLECDMTFAGTATVIGTPHYFSPEMCRGEKYNELTDTWGLGCILYEMICLLRPFHREDHVAMLALRISEGKYDADTLAVQGLAYHDHLVPIVKGLLAMELRDRLRARDALRSLQQIWAEIQTNPAVATHFSVQPLDTSPEMDRICSCFVAGGAGGLAEFDAFAKLTGSAENEEDSASSMGILTALLRESDMQPAPVPVKTDLQDHLALLRDELTEPFPLDQTLDKPLPPMLQNFQLGSSLGETLTEPLHLRALEPTDTPMEPPAKFVPPLGFDSTLLPEESQTPATAQQSPPEVLTTGTSPPQPRTSSSDLPLQLETLDSCDLAAALRPRARTNTLLPEESQALSSPNPPPQLDNSESSQQAAAVSPQLGALVVPTQLDTLDSSPSAADLPTQLQTNDSSQQAPSRPLQLLAPALLQQEEAHVPPEQAEIADSAELVLEDLPPCLHQGGTVNSLEPDQASAAASPAEVIIDTSVQPPAFVPSPPSETIAAQPATSPLPSQQDEIVDCAVPSPPSEANSAQLATSPLPSQQEAIVDSGELVHTDTSPDDASEAEGAPSQLEVDNLEPPASQSDAVQPIVEDSAHQGSSPGDEDSAHQVEDPAQPAPPDLVWDAALPVQMESTPDLPRTYVFESSHVAAPVLTPGLGCVSPSQQQAADLAMQLAATLALHLEAFGDSQSQQAGAEREAEAETEVEAAPTKPAVAATEPSSMQIFVLDSERLENPRAAALPWGASQPTEAGAATEVKPILPLTTLQPVREDPHEASAAASPAFPSFDSDAADYSFGQPAAPLETSQAPVEAEEGQAAAATSPFASEDSEPKPAEAAEEASRQAEAEEASQPAEAEASALPSGASQQAKSVALFEDGTQLAEGEVAAAVAAVASRLHMFDTTSQLEERPLTAVSIQTELSDGTGFGENAVDQEVDESVLVDDIAWQLTFRPVWARVTTPEEGSPDPTELEPDDASYRGLQDDDPPHVFVAPLSLPSMPGTRRPSACDEIVMLSVSRPGTRPGTRSGTRPGTTSGLPISAGLFQAEDGFPAQSSRPGTSNAKPVGSGLFRPEDWFPASQLSRPGASNTKSVPAGLFQPEDWCPAPSRPGTSNGKPVNAGALQAENWFEVPPSRPGTSSAKPINAGPLQAEEWFEVPRAPSPET